MIGLIEGNTFCGIKAPQGKNVKAAQLLEQINDTDALGNSIELSDLKLPEGSFICEGYAKADQEKIMDFVIAHGKDKCHLVCQLHGEGWEGSRDGNFVVLIATSDIEGTLTAILQQCTDSMAVRA